MGLVHQRRQGDVSVAIKRVVRAERHHVPARQHVGQAALHDAAGVERVGVQERRQRDAEDVRAGQLLREGLGDEVVGSPPGRSLPGPQPQLPDSSTARDTICRARCGV